MGVICVQIFLFLLSCSIFLVSPSTRTQRWISSNSLGSPHGRQTLLAWDKISKVNKREAKQRRNNSFLRLSMGQRASLAEKLSLLLAEKAKGAPASPRCMWQHQGALPGPCVVPFVSSLTFSDGNSCCLAQLLSLAFSSSSA